MSEELEKRLAELEKRLEAVVKETVKETVAEELSKQRLRGYSLGSQGSVPVSIYRLGIPVQTTLLALEKSSGKTTISRILGMTGMARSTEAKNLSILREYGYITEEKSVEEPRRKVYSLTNLAMAELRKLPEEYKKELVEKRIKE